MNPHIPHDHFDSHRRCRVGIFFAVFWNTVLSVIALEMSLLCYDQYSKLWCFDILFFILFLDKFEVIVYVMLWYSVVVGWIAPDMDL